MFFSPAQLAEQLHVSVELVYSAIKSGDLPASNVGGPQRPTYRISRDDSEAWLESKKTRPAPPRRRLRRPQSSGVTKFFS